MFIQIIKAKVTDIDAHRRQLDDWVERLSPGAQGWLGATGGVTADGELVQVVRFESEQAARANSDRPEQGKWWSETEQYLENPTFTDTGDVSSFLGGGSDEAGFVQVIEGAVSDRARYEELLREFESRGKAERPDLLGGTIAWHGDGRVSMIAYFTSEAEARAGEAKEMPADLKALDDEWQALMSDVRFCDLTDPILLSP